MIVCQVFINVNIDTPEICTKTVNEEKKSFSPNK